MVGITPPRRSAEDRTLNDGGEAGKQIRSSFADANVPFCDLYFGGGRRDGAKCRFGRSANKQRENSALAKYLVLVSTKVKSQGGSRSRRSGN